MSNRSPRTIGKVWSDTWCQELVAVTISILTYLAILILFAVYDGKPDFQWHGLTLNATISALSTTSRLLLLMIVASCIGQLRWNDFARKQTPVAHIDTWDNASRGVLGCFDLLWKTRSWSIAAIGAWVTILAVGFEPSLQQALRFTSSFSTVPSGDRQFAEIQSALSWAGGRLEGNSAQTTIGGPIIADSGPIGVRSAASLDFSMLSAMYNGIVATPTQISQQAPFTCSSSHCEWESYLSLGVCSACYDVSDAIGIRQASAQDNMHSFNYYWSDYDTDVTNFTGPIFTLPNNLSIWNIPGFSDQALIATKSTSRWSETLQFRGNNTLIFVISVLQFPSSSNGSPNFPQPTATECGVYFCIKSYNSKVINGTLNENASEVSSRMDPSSFNIVPNSNTSYSGPEPPDVLYDPESYTPRTDLRVLPPAANASMSVSDNFSVSQNSAAALIDQAITMFNVSSIGGGLPLGISIGGGGRRTSKFSDVFEPSSVQTLYYSVDIEQTFANLANSMTNDMRRNAQTSQTQKGQVALPVTLIRIRWGWVAFSATIIALGTAFLLTCIFSTRNVSVPLWKTSSLVTFFHQLRPWPFVPASNKLSTHEMTQLTGNWSAKLGDDYTLEWVALAKEAEGDKKRQKQKQKLRDSKTASVQQTSVQLPSTQHASTQSLETPVSTQRASLHRTNTHQISILQAGTLQTGVHRTSTEQISTPQAIALQPNTQQPSSQPTL